MDPLFELAIALPPKGSRERLRALHRQLRAAIFDGRLQPGLRLPSTRTLAKALGVSRNTVIAAYDLLLSDGCLRMRSGAGAFVADIPIQKGIYPTAVNDGTDPRLAAFWRVAPPARHGLHPGPFQFDFQPGVPDTTLFPFSTWRRLAVRAQLAFAKTPSAYVEIEGRLALRDAIARHVSLARAVACHTRNVVVTTGTQQALDLVSRILVTRGETLVALENPGYPLMRGAFAAAGARIAPIPVDAEGLRVDLLPPDTRVICVAPLHQFPLGVAMSLRRRMALLDFARKNNAVVIEDDYDGEFRFDGRPLEALQTLDRTDSVLYVGTFSKCLFPALRLGFVVAPPWARDALIRAKMLTDWQTPVLTQDTLAAFISEGHLARHIRRMRKVYRERCAALVEALCRHCGDAIEPIRADTGMHLAAELHESVNAASVASRAESGGMRIAAVSTLTAGGTARNGLVIGYGKIEAKQMDEAVKYLARLIRQEARTSG